MGKKPRFFCDNCGAEVGHNVKSCPKCGRLFASVRCPSCNFVGGDDTFANGCPVCGYSASGAKPSGRAAKREKQRPLPFWAFFLSVGILVFAFAVLFLVLV